MPRLVLLSEGMTGRAYDLKVEKTTVGRVAENTFEIPESSVSSHHAELILRGNEVLVRDLGSTNGTFINGEKISEGVLKPGQILRLGTVDMRLELGDVASSSIRKPLDQTRVIPQGVKPDDLEGSRPVGFETNKAFSKKSNKGTKIFIALVIATFIALIAALWYVLTNKPQH